MARREVRNTRDSRIPRNPWFRRTTGFSRIVESFVMNPTPEGGGLPVVSTGFRGPASTTPTIGRMTSAQSRSASRQVRTPVFDCWLPCGSAFGRSTPCTHLLFLCQQEACRYMQDQPSRDSSPRLKPGASSLGSVSDSEAPESFEVPPDPVRVAEPALIQMRRRVSGQHRP